MARKKNPGALGTLGVLALLAVGGYVVYDQIIPRMRRKKSVKEVEEKSTKPLVMLGVSVVNGAVQIRPINLTTVGKKGIGVVTPEGDFSRIQISTPVPVNILVSLPNDSHIQNFSGSAAMIPRSETEAPDYLISPAGIGVEQVKLDMVIEGMPTYIPAIAGFSGPLYSVLIEVETV